MNQALKTGREWATKRLREYAQKANVPIDNASWHDVNKDASEFVVESHGEKKSYEIENLDLEDDDEDRRNYVDQIMELIVKGFLKANAGKALHLWPHAGVENMFTSEPNLQPA